MPLTETVASALGKLVLQGDELKQMLDRARSRDYWLELNPDLAISEDLSDPWTVDPPPDDVQLAMAIQNYRQFGYLSIDGMLAPEHARRMGQCVRMLRTRGWPAVFVFVYDAFWLIGRTKTIRRLLSELLEPTFFLLPRIWAHYVYTAKGNAGWTPHIDGGDGAAHTTSMWVPLSQASPSNG